MGAGVNGNNQWEWEGNVNKSRLNVGLGMEMGINHWDWDGMGLKKIFPLISSAKLFYNSCDEHALMLVSCPKLFRMTTICSHASAEALHNRLGSQSTRRRARHCQDCCDNGPIAVTMRRLLSRSDSLFIKHSTEDRCLQKITVRLHCRHLETVL